VNKQVPSLGKILVMVGFALSCFGLLLFLWLAFGGPTPLKPKGYRFKVAFGEATQLAKEADVRISGVPVGKVKDIQTNQRTGRSDATIELESAYAPIPQDAKAILRQKTLLGETYVELTPGSPNARKVPDNGRLATSQVGSTVELDEIFRAFDPKTRQAFQTWMQQQALSIDGRGRDLSDAIGNLAPFAEDTTKLLTILNTQKTAVRQLVRNTGEVFDALSERDGQLASLITNSNRVFATTAARDAELQAAFRALPTFERESKTTVERLAGFATNANPVVTDLRPAARELSPTLVKLSQLAPDLKALFRDLNPLFAASVKGLPATEQFIGDLQKLLPEFDGPLKQLNPILDGGNLYRNELAAFFANSAAATGAASPAAGSSENVHYLRTTNPMGPENIAQYAKRLNTNRPNPYHFPGDYTDIANGGMKVFENRQCTSSSPTHFDVADPVEGILNAALRNNVIQFALNGGDVPAPPCRLQDRFSVQGKVTRYPQVGADIQGLRPGAPQP
jgi:phospholipid/cholesterol/gamma-HCH transport system substrate-binding protein